MKKFFAAFSMFFIPQILWAESAPFCVANESGQKVYWTLLSAKKKAQLFSYRSLKSDGVYECAKISDSAQLQYFATNGKSATVSVGPRTSLVLSLKTMSSLRATNLSTNESAPQIVGVETSVTALIGAFAQGPLNEPTMVHGMGDLHRIFGQSSAARTLNAHAELFFTNGGEKLVIVRIPAANKAQDFIGDRNDKTGLYALEKLDIFNLLIIPEAAQLPQDQLERVYSAALAYVAEKSALAILDPPLDSIKEVSPGVPAVVSWLEGSKFRRDYASYGALYFPGLNVVESTTGAVAAVGASGAMAGLYAFSDSDFDVWTTPAGLSFSLSDVVSLNYLVTDQIQGVLNPLGINAIRSFPIDGIYPFGGRTLERDSKFSYLSVRRLDNYLRLSLQYGLQWAAYEDNTSELQQKVTAVVRTFLTNLWGEGAFVGFKTDEAFYVTCDATNNPEQSSTGRLNVRIGYAPIYAGDFNVIDLSIEQESY
ncbi:phage tail sheath C-terminal domain-containing protein [Bdellovibrio sp.]|uniref:phage tail sheath family protein n=1 Tax=Bdellovibrio sp. TaxID=28201 RepID=UPI0039E3C896